METAGSESDSGHHRRAHRGQWIAGIVVALVVVVGGAAGYFVWDRYLRNESNPVDVAAVEEGFSKAGKGGTAQPGDPTPGVYLYRTVGNESVSALGGATNTYPATTTLTITDTPCGADTRGTCSWAASTAPAAAVAPTERGS